MELTELLTVATNRHASDLHLSTGLPPMLRVHGDIQTLDLPALEAEQLRQMLGQAMTPNQQTAFARG